LDDSVRASPILPGYKEAEEGDSSLSAALDSLLPSLIAPFDSEPLPIFLGKEALDPKVDTGSSSSHALVKGSKAFSWSRDIGSELSPVKTCSSQKKHMGLSIQSNDNVPTSPDTGALRAMKALVREK